jgi:hypothetical protein
MNGLKHLWRPSTWLVIIALCLANGGGTALAAVPGKHARPLVSHPSHAACGRAKAGHARCLAHISQSAVPRTSAGYGPSEFHTAYQLPCTPNGPVASVCAAPSSFGPETIAIVDAGSYGASGTLESALQTYDNNYGLPACTAANGCLSVVNQSGASSPLPANVSSGWSDEIAMDVESAHMICQTCKIVLVEANDDFVNNLSAAEVTAVGFQPIAISNSWGSTSDVSAYDGDFKYNGIAVVAATGDNGSNTNGQSWPADIPEVVAASGTTLQLNTDNTWANETVWASSGGGCSLTYAAPSWQTGRSDWAGQGCGSERSFADVSADGDPNSGAAIVVGSSWYMAGGTSLATPLIAAMYALGDDLPASTSAVTLPYQHASSSTIRDIIAGNDCLSVGQTHCTATAGFDTPSGLGAPKGVAAFQAHTPEDINQDAHVNLLDFSLLASKYGQAGNSLGRVDINHDGQVNLLDFSLLANKYGT